MSAVANRLSFEVLRFAAEPVSAEVALLELEGRFRADPRRRLGVPRLVVEHARISREVPPAAADEAQADPDGAPWRATYAVALELLDDGDFSLAVGRELLVGLPAPHWGNGADDRQVRLAREANALRRTADEARSAAAAALASVGAERAAREAAEAELAEARLARDDHARRAAGLDDELATARREHAAEIVRRDEELQAAVAGRDAHAAQAAEERALGMEAEVAEARRAVRNARAETEALRRDLDRERERADLAQAALPRGRVTELDGEPVEGQPLEDRPTTRIDGRADATPAEVAAPSDQDATLEQSAAAPPAADSNRSAPVEGEPGETVRVLGARRPRRSGEGAPAEAAPGTAEIGARHIEPGQTPQRSAAEEWLTRALAVAALAVVVVAVLLVLKPF
jgi:hypothetical protein